MPTGWAATLLGAMLGGVLTLEVKGIEFVMTALFVTIFTDQWLNAKRHGPRFWALRAQRCAWLCSGRRILCCLPWHSSQAPCLSGAA